MITLCFAFPSTEAVGVFCGGVPKDPLVIAGIVDRLDLLLDLRFCVIQVVVFSDVGGGKGLYIRTDCTITSYYYHGDFFYGQTQKSRRNSRLQGCKQNR